MSAELPRFIRTNPRSSISEEALTEQLGVPLTPIPWLPNFFSLDGAVKIAGSAAYKNGEIYGIDASSGAAVLCLDPQPGDHILDLCCAPGAKLCMLSDMLRQREELSNCGLKGSVTGVDITKHRLAACQTLIKKYEITNCRVFLEDGTTFHEPSPVNEQPWYDRVLVDAECTHDGSLKHVFKFSTSWGWDTFARRVLDPERISTITSLQKQLLANGFKMLKDGGTLVYSTCSFCRSQNEDVVGWLLENNTNAQLVPIAEAATMPCRDGSIPHTLRFDPVTSCTGGLFIAKIMKLGKDHRV
eukprot:GILJ01011228.1.p1 GENE.GILJ01011228.1~~GILJ01011228.1.p1  ORF type:complete len:321 (+),score=27.12 GILJ01011228.1:66-965(+)